MATLHAHAASLAEHFGSVNIIVTRYEHEITEIMAAGQGDYYARMGATEHWLRSQKRS